MDKMGNYTDINNLNSITPPSFNTSMLNDSTTLIPNVIATANNLVGDLWFTAGTFTIFLVLSYMLYRKDGNFIYDVMRSMFISSCFTLFIAIGVTLSGWTYTILPVIWYGTLWFVLGIAVYNLKLKNQ